VEGQVRAHLAKFALPDETVREVVRLYEQASGQRNDADRRRRELTGRLERTKEMYGWGDLTREAYTAERDRIEAELAGLRGAGDRAAVLVQAAAFLRDLPAAWDAASPEQRNTLARLVFQAVEVLDDRVVAVTPTADFAPFFNATNTDAAPETGGGVKRESEEAEATGVGPALASRVWRCGHCRRSPAPRDRPIQAGCVPDAAAA
jgi:hypothetical protein